MRALICPAFDFLRRFLANMRLGRGTTVGLLKMLLLVILALVPVSGLTFAALPPELPDTIGIKPVGLSAQNLSLAVSLPRTGASNVLMQSLPPKLPAGSGGSLAIGEPDVPVFAEWVLIPNGTQLSIQIHPGEPVVFYNVDITPVQPPKLNSVEAPIPEFTMNTITYSLNQDYPGIFAETGPIKKVRGQSCALVRLYPYQYNPVTRSLSVYENLEVNIQFEGDIRPIPRRFKNRQFESMLTRLTINGDIVISTQEKNINKGEITDEISPLNGQTTTDNFGNGQNGGCDYLIICAPEFEMSANIFAGWKRLSGFRTKVVTTNETGTTAERIQSFIKDSMEDWTPAPSYILLLGDAEYIPCFYTRIHPGDSFPYGLMQGEIASDRYYGDINEDGLAEIFVGRLSVNTAAEAKVAIDRIINYERTPPDPEATENFYKNFAVVSFFEDYDGDGYEDVRFIKGMEDIYNFMTAAGCTGRRIYCTDPSVTPTNWTTWEAFIFENDGGGGQPIPNELLRPGFDWHGKRDDIIESLTNGLFLIIHLGHGSRSFRYLNTYVIDNGGWYSPDFSEQNAATIKNGSLVPVLWSPGCETGWFDNETDRGSYDYYYLGEVYATLLTGPEDESFCEQLMINPQGGAVGIIGSTRTSYGPLADRMIWGWMDAIWPGFIESCKDTYGDSTPIYQMGAVFEYGKQYMLTKFTDPNYSDYLETTIDEFIWFGDPAMEMWTSVPDPLTAENVTYPNSIELGKPTDVTVTVRKDSKPLADARVTISRATAPDDYWTGLTNASGKITFDSVTTSQWGDYNIIVTLHNHIPYEGVISSAASGANIIMVESKVSQSADDGYAYSEGNHNLNSDYLRVGKNPYEQPPYNMAGMVFRNVNIPRGAEIINASLIVRSRTDRLSSIVYGVLEAEATDNADSFGGSRRMASLPKTNASVEWDLVDPWSEETWYTSPDISDLIQEIVSRDGWSENNSLAIFYSTRIHEGAFRTLSSYDSDPDHAPKLQITYVGSQGK